MFQWQLNQLPAEHTYANCSHARIILACDSMPEAARRCDTMAAVRQAEFRGKKRRTGRQQTHSAVCNEKLHTGRCSLSTIYYHSFPYKGNHNIQKGTLSCMNAGWVAEKLPAALAPGSTAAKAPQPEGSSPLHKLSFRTDRTPLPPLACHLQSCALLQATVLCQVCQGLHACMQARSSALAGEQASCRVNQNER